MIFTNVLTDSIILHKVEIYKYVGDEAILTWTIHDGIQDANCISVYFHFQQYLIKRANYYEEKYGLVPEFKAGVNYGMVTVTEIGDIKRDITYLSDVLNAAARIQGKCNEFKKNILISKDLFDILPSNTKYTFNNLGPISLLGKQELVEIYSVEQQLS